MKLLRLSILVLLFYGCNSEKHFLKLAAKHPEWLKTTDSITTSVDTTRTYKDTVIKIPSSLSVDTTSVPMMPLDTNIKKLLDSIGSHNEVHSKTLYLSNPYKKVTHSGNSTNILTILPNGKIIDSCKCDSAKAIIKQLKEVISKTTKEQKTIVIPPDKPNFFQRVWNKYKDGCVWFVSIILILIALDIILRSFKLINKSFVLSILKKIIP